MKVVVAEQDPQYSGRSAISGGALRLFRSRVASTGPVDG